MDYVRTEFGRYEAAIRKRHGELLDHIEREVGNINLVHSGLRDC